MRSDIFNLAVAAVLAQSASTLPTERQRQYEDHHYDHDHERPMSNDYRVSYDPRPFYIIDNMTDSPLKAKLQSCENGPFSVTSFSIGHRGGATLQFPEETVENTIAGARMGAGILECDVAFTKDLGLVCRHSQCDLHTTTNILLHPELASQCTVPFTAANATSPANALCCTSDITTAEYMSLCGKQDGFNASATNVEDYQHGTPTWRTDLYSTCGTVQSLDSYITLVESLPGHRNYTPELKTPPAQVPMPFNGYTQTHFARALINSFIARNISASRVWAQSFHPPDIYQWIAEFPSFGRQAVYLDEDGDTPATLANASSLARLAAIKARGVNIIAPPFGYLLTTTADNKTIMPSTYAHSAKAAGLDIIPWTFERSGPLATVKARNEYYYGFFAQGVGSDGQLYEILDVLARQVGIKAIFSDWASTVSYYANCFGLEYGGFLERDE
ncbi:related to glycerophosphoryl diester phosphodiesterase family protein [Rhynchosporium agropyri]|uniref:glycerophosphodiester phosphodiesterase n=1 Tax=Rhynchosporium agropyri TaxID=914238 RepID=A0A1E1KI60_9HELO|nr:related to glycerophosphoryl diester phosphodiesterase family protein [Rhynchosporium agropyri]